MRYSRLGYAYNDQFAHKGDIKSALIKIYKHNYTMDEEVETYQYGLESSIPPHGHDKQLAKPVGGLLIKRSDIKQVYSESGYSQYPWAIETENITEWKWFPVDGVESQFEAVRNKPKQPTTKTTQVSAVFSKFESLRANEISLVIMKDKMAKMVIRGKTIKVHTDELGIKAGSQDWKLLEGAAVSQGSLANALNKLNSTSNLEAERGKIKTAVSRLRKSLKDAIGLRDNPIKYTKYNGYKFTFKFMSHELLKDGNVSKGDDAMDYTHDKGFDDNRPSNSGFWNEDE